VKLRAAGPGRPACERPAERLPSGPWRRPQVIGFRLAEVVSILAGSVRDATAAMVLSWIWLGVEYRQIAS